MSKVFNVGFPKPNGQLSGFQYLIFSLNISNVSEFFKLEEIRDHILGPINDSLSLCMFSEYMIIR